MPNHKDETPTRGLLSTFDPSRWPVTAHLSDSVKHARRTIGEQLTHERLDRLGRDLQGQVGNWVEKACHTVGVATKNDLRRLSKTLDMVSEKLNDLDGPEDDSKGNQATD